MPAHESWKEMLSAQLGQPYEEKQSYCTIWELDGRAVGHCNVNDIVFGEQAYMHLHLWESPDRKKGHGSELVRLSLPYFFRNLKLQRLFSAPYALNPAPNKALERAGFRFVKEYHGMPGSFSFEQQAMLWTISREMLEDV
jgi:RimJ/RimL family protein N-acetyltransferase